MGRNQAQRLSKDCIKVRDYTGILSFYLELMRDYTGIKVRDYTGICLPKSHLLLLINEILRDYTGTEYGITQVFFTFFELMHNGMHKFQKSNESFCCGITRVLSGLHG